MLGIIGLILAAGISYSVGLMEAARYRAAEGKMQEYAAKLEAYRMEAGHYPASSQGPLALVEKPTSEPTPRRWRKQMTSIPKDPWGEDYVYRYPGTKESSTYEIVCKGGDRVIDTEDDISSQDPE